MIRIMYCKKNNSGLALLMVMGTILILEVTCLLLFNSKGTSAIITHNRIIQLKALYCAEAGIAHELWRIQEDPNWRSKPAEHILGDGSYTISFSEDESHGKIVITCNALVKGAASSARRTVHYLTIKPHHTLESTYNDDADTYIMEGRPDEIKYSDEELRLDSENNAGTKRCRTLALFNLRKYSLPQDAKILSSRFSMYLLTPNDTEDYIGEEGHEINKDTYRIHKISNKWWPDETNWNYRKTGWWLEWDSPGGDFDAQYEDSCNFTENGWKTWRVTTMTRSWLNDPDRNYGLIIETDGRPGNNECKFSSSDNDEDEEDLARAPQLTIYYLDDRSP